MKKGLRMAAAALLAAAVLVQAGCNNSKEPVEGTDYNVSNEKNPVVTITMSDDKKIIMELYPDQAPESVNNFIDLIGSGFYDGLTFHRIEPGFVIQGGDPLGNGTGGPGYSIKGEFEANGIVNDISHKRGVLSMARSQMPDSAGSQFFICVDDADFLDKNYAAFGEVVYGMETVDKIVSDYTSGKLKEAPTMKTVTVDTKGTGYPAPEKLDEY